MCAMRGPGRRARHAHWLYGRRQRHVRRMSRWRGHCEGRLAAATVEVAGIIRAHPVSFARTCHTPVLFAKSVREKGKE